IGRAVETLHAHNRLQDLSVEKKTPTLDQIDKDEVRRLLSPRNAVNLLDIERLAMDVPGTRVARARAWASVHPGYPCLHAPGVVTVVVMPVLPIAKPMPTPGLLAAVKAFLNHRGIVCTRLEVIGPDYLEVSVVAGRVQARVGADNARVQTRI